MKILLKHDLSIVDKVNVKIWAHKSTIMRLRDNFHYYSTKTILSCHLMGCDSSERLPG